MNNNDKLIINDINAEHVIVENNNTIEKLEIHIDNSTYEHVTIFLYYLPLLKQIKCYPSTDNSVKIVTLSPLTSLKKIIFDNCKGFVESEIEENLTQLKSYEVYTNTRHLHFYNNDNLKYITDFTYEGDEPSGRNGLIIANLLFLRSVTMSGTLDLNLTFFNLPKLEDITINTEYVERNTTLNLVLGGNLPNLNLLEISDLYRVVDNSNILNDDIDFIMTIDRKNFVYGDFCSKCNILNIYADTITFNTRECPSLKELFIYNYNRLTANSNFSSLKKLEIISRVNEDEYVAGGETETDINETKINLIGAKFPVIEEFQIHDHLLVEFLSNYRFTNTLKLMFLFIDKIKIFQIFFDTTSLPKLENFEFNPDKNLKPGIDYNLLPPSFHLVLPNDIHTKYLDKIRAPMRKSARK